METNTVAPKWLALFLLFCSLYIAPWMLGFAGWYDNQPYRDIMFYTPFRHIYFMGPALYFYVQSLLNPKFRLTRKNSIHFLPGILYLVYNAVIVVTDKLVLKKYYFLADGSDRDFETWYSVSGVVHMFFYLAASLRYYKIYRDLMPQVISYSDTLTFKWIRNFLAAFLTILLLSVVFDTVTLFYPEMAGYTSTWWFFFFFAIITAYIAVSGYSNTLRTTVPFDVSLLAPEKATVYTDKEENAIPIKEVRVPDTGIDESLHIVKSQISAYFDEERPYNDPELTLPDVAGAIDVPVAVVSKAINKGFGMNFNDYVNRYRVEAVKKAFEKGDQQKQTLLGIAFNCGFNSKATFNRAFKKHTGQSPREYMLETAPQSVTE